MPTEAENVQYLYLVLTSDGPPTIDWDAIGSVLDLKKGAVTKRWSRLKQIMEKGEAPSSSTYQFLWLCVKHSKRDKAMNWDEIATKCNTTSGAASKRYSRMKQAFEEGVAPPGVSPKVTPSKTKPTPKSTPKKIAATSPDDANGDGEEEYAGATSTPTSKRKRASSKKKPQATAEEQKFKPNPEDDEDGLSDEEMERKRVKAIKCKATPKPKPKPEAIVNPSAVKTQGARTPTTEATTLVKSENDDDDAFHDAQEEQQDDQEHGYVDDATAARVHGWLKTSA